MKRVAVLAAVLIAVVALTGQTRYDTDISTAQKELDRLRREAEKTKELARKYAKEEADVLTQVSQAEQAIAASRKFIDGLERREAEVQDDIRATEAALEETRATLERQRSALREHVRHMYKHGRAQSLEVVLSAESFPELLERTVFLSKVLRADRLLVKEVEDQEAEVGAHLKALQEDRRELQELQGEKRAEEAQYRDLKEQRARQLKKVRSQKTYHENMAQELEQSARRLQGVLQELERKRRDALKREDPALLELDRRDFAKNRGRLPWPTSGQVVSEYGRHVHPKYKTVTLNNGIDIQAPMGTAVRCVGDGLVDVVRWLEGYGQSVIVNHGNGYYSIYAHLSAVHVAQGDAVIPGQVLGAVGDTGSIKGPVLHFELRRGGKAQDPRAWLR